MKIPKLSLTGAPVTKPLLPNGKTVTQYGEIPNLKWCDLELERINAILEEEGEDKQAVIKWGKNEQGAKIVYLAIIRKETEDVDIH
jgi:hypothetical protein|tara:strand:+ start:1014 stop:1271 length:258 start_codon:yes stop_codon:yes gene_type:complete